MASDPDLSKTQPPAEPDDGVAPTVRSDRSGGAAVERTVISEPKLPRAGLGEDCGDEDTAIPAGALLLGRYEIRRELARGGMGRVLVAYDRRLQREVAVKELLDPSPEARTRFEREVQVTARLQHPSIVTIHEAGTDSRGDPFYVMPQVPGRSLHEAIAEAATLEARLALMPQVIAACEALAYAHDRGVIHRDLKPANILVGPFGETVVIDWGLAKTMGEAEPEPAPTAANSESGRALTVAGQVMGTPGYMPPEQARGAPLDERSDVFALGAILWHLLVGGPPYDGESVVEILAAVISGPPPEPDWRGVPADLVAIVRKALAHDRDQRYPGARALVEDLRRFQAGQLVGAHRYSSLERVARWAHQHRQLLAAAAVATVLLFALGAVALARVVEAKGVAVREREAATRAQAEAERLQRKAELDRQASLLQQAHVQLASDPTGTLELLTQLSPALPGWEQARFIAEEALAGDVARWELDLAEATTACAVHDGHRVVLGTRRGELLLFDLRDGSTRRLGAHPAAISDLIVSDDDRLLLSSAEDGSAQLWDLASGQARPLSHSGVPIVRGMFLQDGSTLLVRRDRALEILAPGAQGSPELLRGPLFRLLPRDHIALIEFGTGEVRVVRRAGEDLRGRMPAGLGFTTPTVDGKHLVGRDPSRGLEIIDLPRGDAHLLSGSESTVAIAPALLEGGQVAALLEPRSYGLWDGSGALLGRGQLDCDASNVFALDHHRLLAQCEDALELVELPFGARRLVRMPRASTAFISRDGELLIQLDPHLARIWDLGDHPLPLLETRAPIDRLTGTPGGLVLAFVGTSPGQVERVTASPLALAPLSPVEGSVRTAALSADGSRGAWVTEAGDRAIWMDLATGARHELKSEQAVDVAFSPDARLLAVADARGVRIVELETGATREVPLPDGVQSVWLTGPDALVVLTRAPQHLVALGPDGRLLRQLGDGDARSSLSRDGRTLLTVSGSRKLELWRTADWTRLAAIEARTDIQAATFGPSADELVTCDRLGAMELWSTKTGEGRTLTMLPRGADELLPSADGRTVLTWDGSGGVNAVELGTGATWLLREPAGAFDDAAISRDPPGFLTARGHELRFWRDDLPHEPEQLLERLREVPRRITPVR